MFSYISSRFIFLFLFYTTKGLRLLIHLLIQRRGFQLPEFYAFVCLALVQWRGVEVADGFEHGATLILSIELCEGSYLVREQEVEVLLGDIMYYCSCSFSRYSISYISP